MHAVWPIFKYLDEAIFQKRKLVQCLFTLNSPFECPYTLGCISCTLASMLNTISIIVKFIHYILPLQEKEILQGCLAALLNPYNVFLCFLLL